MDKRRRRSLLGVILAAGVGDRIKPLSFSWPKPLLPVGNKPIMQYQIELMKKIGINDFIVVVGHLKERIIDYFKDGKSLGVTIKYIVQKESLGIAHAIGNLEEYIDRPFLLFLGDIFIIPKNIKEIITKFYKYKAGAVLAVKKEKDPQAIKRNYSIILDNQGRVRRVIEKPRHLTTNLKGCGIYLFDLSIFDAIRCTPRTAMRDEYEITTSIQMLIDDSCPVYTAEIVAWDMNITEPCDLLLCNQTWLKFTKRKSFVDPSSKINRQAKIYNSSIGKDARIVNPIRIRNSVILDGAKVESKQNIVNSLVSPSATINCKALKDNA